ncbi:MAG: hypothetical protein ABWY04_06510 [Arthrobacter sp.]
MHNEFPISITINPPGGERPATGGSADAAPSPLGLDVLGSPADTAQRSPAGSPGDAPAPLPLDQLTAAATGWDTPPSPSESFAAAEGTTAPEPLPPEELQDKGNGAGKESAAPERTGKR